ncbi:MAG: 4Fe-4S binding protein [Desulfarculus sp.]|nr:4Fe-4S binding protein [Desulfarculus sp.]
MAGMKWENSAEHALKRVPFFVRPLARMKVEERVGGQGRALVTLADFQQAEAAFKALRGGRGDAELAKMLPQDNQPGVEMTLLESCRAELADCPNRLLDTEPWRQALERWLRDDDISERLRQRLPEHKVLHHHKLKLSLGGCPNGCSRPQVADLALVGFVQPRFDLAGCTACGACVGACPDQAIAMSGEGPVWDQEACLGCRACARVCPAGCISLSEPRARVLLGGKLGRHPRLAQVAATAVDPEQALAVLRQSVEQYLRDARPGQRFADWWGQRATAGPVRP